MLTSNSFKEMLNKLQEDFGSQDYAAALSRLKDGYLEFPEKKSILDYWHLILLAGSGKPDQALAAFEKSLGEGNWFSEVNLRKSPSLLALQGNPKFELLLARNQENAEKDRAGQFPYYILRPEGKCKAGNPPCPLFIGLHSRGGSAADCMDFWKPAASLGWLVAVPQSSQALMKGVYVWDDEPTAEDELLRDYTSLGENYSINPWQTVLAGYASGSETALWLTLRGKLEIHSFLAISPSGAGILNLGKWRKILNDELSSGIRGYFLIGELDETVHLETIAELADILNLAGVVTEMEIIRGVNEEFQPGYDEAIGRALNFLVG